MATRHSWLRKGGRSLGKLRRLPEYRDDTAYLMSSQENVRRLNAAIRELNEGKGIPTTFEEIRARLGLDR